MEFWYAFAGMVAGFVIGYLIGTEDGKDAIPQKEIDIYNWGYKDGFNDAEKYRDTIYDKRINK